MENKNDNPEFVKKSNILVEDRKKMSVNGVFEVLSFDDEKVVLNTTLKKLEIIGNNLKISRLDLKNGEVNITGNINELKYLNDTKSKEEKPNFIKKILGKKWW